MFQYTITSYRLKSTENILTLLQLPTNYLKKFTSTSDQPESVTGDRKSLTFLSRLNEAANVQEINSVVMNEEEFVLKQIGNEPVVVRSKPKTSGKFSLFEIRWQRLTIQ